MKQLLFFSTVFFLSAKNIHAQTVAATDSSTNGTITVYKDSRIDELAKREAAFNEATAKSAARSGKGYRLMLLNTNDRPLAMKVRTQLLQRYPEQKVYMSFQPPYIKMKFGNFLDKEEAEDYKKEITRYKIVTGNIYVVPDQIEVKPDKNKEK